MIVQGAPEDVRARDPRDPNGGVGPVLLGFNHYSLSRYSSSATDRLQRPTRTTPGAARVTDLLERVVLIGLKVLTHH